MSRVYLDWNATAPLRPEARNAMIAAMDILGNPSSVHAEGRKAKAIVERARLQIKSAFGASSKDIVFTSGATEAAAIHFRDSQWSGCKTEHDCIQTWTQNCLTCDSNGIIEVSKGILPTSAIQAANSETGVLQGLQKGLGFSDFVQAFGKIPIAFDWLGIQTAILSAHKVGGPKGIGALVIEPNRELGMSGGGGQEEGRRPGTENVVGIAGFGAAAEAAQRDLDNGVWEPVEALRNNLEVRLADAAPDAIFVGQTAKRLPNTSCIVVPGWKGETQVMQMDLAGYAISAGSACSSGKVKQSRVLKTMGFDDKSASSAIRVSIGPTTTEQDVMGFADTWLAHYKKFKARAA